MNILAIFVSALVYFIIGFLFHGPLFGKTWMRLANIVPTGNEKISDMYGQMFSNYIANVLTAFVLSGAIWIAFSSPIMGEITWYKGAIIAFWAWLGFVASGSSMEVIWMGRSKKLWLFEITSSLVGLMAMGIILAIWQ